MSGKQPQEKKGVDCTDSLNKIYNQLEGMVLFLSNGDDLEASNKIDTAAYYVWDAWKYCKEKGL